MKTNRLPVLSVLLILQACVLTVHSNGTLPDEEMRELDVFLHDDKYDDISRTKRTDNGTIDEDGASGEMPLQVDIAVDSTATVVSETDVIQTDTVPQEQGPVLTNSESTTYSAHATEGPPAIPTDSGPVDIPDADADTNINATNEAGPALADNETASNSATPTEVPPAIATESGSVDIPVVDPNQKETQPEPHAENTEAPVIANGTATDLPEIGDRYGGIIEPNNPDSNSTQSQDVNATHTTVDNKQQQSSSSPQPGITGANNTNSNSRAVVPAQVPTAVDGNGVNTTNTSADNKSQQSSNDLDPASPNKTSTVPEIKQNSPTATEAPKPPVAETEKASVSGSGVLFTIIILAAIAALAGIGYFMYKRRKTQYDPVAIEDTDKEMTEVRSENGYFGKPITAEEVRTEDQLTPMQPKPAPRTFGPNEEDEKDLEKVEVIKDDEDRDKREQSVEFQEEVKKAEDR